MHLVSRIVAFQLAVAMSALICMGTVTALDVFFKFAFNRPIAGAYDVVESLLPVVIFNGLPATLLRRKNVVIDLIDHLITLNQAKVLIKVVDVVVVAVLALIVYAMIQPAYQAFEYGDRKIELGLPIVVIWGATLLGMLGAIASSIVVLLQKAEPLSSRAD
jgi:TRAP-type C4-dicarboxylate transport system permease small subunit